MRGRLRLTVLLLCGLGIVVDVITYPPTPILGAVLTVAVLAAVVTILRELRRVG